MSKLGVRKNMKSIAYRRLAANTLKATVEINNAHDKQSKNMPKGRLDGSIFIHTAHRLPDTNGPTVITRYSARRNIARIF
jgi:hypothetical protein